MSLKWVFGVVIKGFGLARVHCTKNYLNEGSGTHVGRSHAR